MFSPTYLNYIASHHNEHTRSSIHTPTVMAKVVHHVTSTYPLSFDISWLKPLLILLQPHELLFCSLKMPGSILTYGFHNKLFFLVSLNLSSSGALSERPSSDHLPYPITKDNISPFLFLHGTYHYLKQSYLL